MAARAFPCHVPGSMLGAGRQRTRLRSPALLELSVSSGGGDAKVWTWVFIVKGPKVFNRERFFPRIGRLPGKLSGLSKVVLQLGMGSK